MAGTSEINALPDLLSKSWLPIAGDSIRARFARAAIWSLCGAIVSQLFSSVSSIMAARLLGRESFGEFGMIQSTVALFSWVAGLSLGMTATKYVAALRTSAPHRAAHVILLTCGASFAVGSIASVLLFITAGSVAGHINAPHLMPLLRTSCPLIVLTTVFGTQCGALAGFEDFRGIASITLNRSIATLPVLVGFTLLWGLSGSVGALVMTAAFGVILSSRTLLQRCNSDNVRLDPKGLFREMPVLWKFSMPAFLSGSLSAPLLWAASAVLANSPQGYGQLGLFNAAHQWKAVVVALPAVITQPLLPMLTRLQITHDRRYVKLLVANIAFALSTAFVIAILIVAAAPWLRAAYGEQFRAMFPVLAPLLAAAIVSAAGAVVVQAMASTGHMWLGCGLNCVSGCAFILTCIYWAPRFGALGMGYAVLVSHILHAAALAIYTVMVVRRHSSPSQVG